MKRLSFSFRANFGLLLGAVVAQNVGIGTNVPDARLHVRTPATADFARTGWFQNQRDAADNNGVLVDIARASTDAYALNVRSGVGAALTSRFYVRGDGNVGIGTTNPRERLQIGDRFTFHDGTDKYIGYNVYRGGNPVTDRYILADEASNIAFLSDGRILFRVAASGAADAPINWRDVMRIENNGSVLGRFRHVTYHSLNLGGWLGNNATTQTLWLPSAGGDGEDDCTATGLTMCGGLFRRAWTVPYQGRIVKVTLCIVQDGGSNPDIQAGLAFYKRPVTNNANELFYSYITQMFTLNDNGCQTISLPENTFTFDAGDMIAVGLYKRGNNSDRIEDIDYFVTIVWEYYAWD